MEIARFQEMRLEAGASVYLETEARVVRAGTFEGIFNSPLGGGMPGVVLSIDSDRRVVEWIEMGHVRAINVVLRAE